jgi:hypothetical protein
MSYDCNRFVGVFYRSDEIVVDQLPCFKESSVHVKRHLHILVWLLEKIKVVFPISIRVRSIEGNDVVIVGFFDEVLCVIANGLPLL